MKHEKALSIRTLTEAMLNASNLGDTALQSLLREQIQGMVVPAPQKPETSVGEAGQPDTSSELNDDDHVVLNFIAGGCPCCVVFDALAENRELPLGDEKFLYTFGAGAGYDELAAVMQSVATKGERYSLEKDSKGEDLAPFRKRFAEFTQASLAAREQLVAEGRAPELPSSVKSLNDVLVPLLERLVKARKENI